MAAEAPVLKVAADEPAAFEENADQSEVNALVDAVPPPVVVGFDAVGVGTSVVGVTSCDGTDVGWPPAADVLDASPAAADDVLKNPVAKSGGGADDEEEAPAESDDDDEGW